MSNFSLIAIVVLVSGPAMVWIVAAMARGHRYPERSHGER
jgi:hypothetical protein